MGGNLYMNDRPAHVRKKFGDTFAVMAVTLLVGCASTSSQLSTVSQWESDGNGNYVDSSSGRVISKDQYSRLVAREVYMRLQSQGGDVPAWCLINP